MHDPKIIVERGYDKVVHEYAQLEGKGKWPRMHWLWKVLNELKTGSSVLDLGCGSGDPADIEVSKQHRITGIDISQEQINLARRNIPTGIFIHGDIGTIEFPEPSFEAVISFYSLEHIPRKDHPVLLGKIYRWLKEGGFLLVSTEAGEYDDVVGEWLGVPMFISSYGPETTMQFIVDAGFELIETAIETQMEGEVEIPYLWIFARKPRD